MITIHQFPPAFGLTTSVSPFCTKLECYLRLTNRQYSTVTGNVLKSPNRKVPYVTLADGEVMADSGDICGRLDDDDRGLDAGLTEEQLATAEHLRRMAEDSLYYCVLASRFIDPGGWSHQQATVKGLVPWFVAPIAVPMIRRSQVALCRDHGSPTMEDAVLQTDRICDDLSEALGDNSYFLGSEPHIVDCSIWSNLVHAAATLSDNGVTDRVRRDERLMGFVRRMATKADLPLPVWA